MCVEGDSFESCALLARGTPLHAWHRGASLARAAPQLTQGLYVYGCRVDLLRRPEYGRNYPIAHRDRALAQDDTLETTDSRPAEQAEARQLFPGRQAPGADGDADDHLEDITL